MVPIKMNKGTATSTSLLIVPNMRWGRAKKKLGSKTPIAMPIRPNINADPAKVKATGNPLINAKHVTANSHKSK
jgi:hypothetical protein